MRMPRGCSSRVSRGILFLWIWTFVWCAAGGPPAATADQGGSAQPALRVGAAAVDISPRHLPALVSGGFLARTADTVRDRLFARALVLDDGSTRLALVVVDTLMMPRELVDRVRRAAAAGSGIEESNIVLAATHTHSAPSVMGALGTGVDEAYVKQLPDQIVEAVCRAAQRLEPAQVGWAVIDAPEHTHCRRWIRRPDRMGGDPFGQRTVRAMMHPGYQNPDYIGPAGPADPQLSVVAFRSPGGRPIALVANYSMHYFGAAPVSPDYFGLFARMVAEKLESKANDRPIVAAMSQGTSGDLHWMDYSRPRKQIDIVTYARQLTELALQAYHRIEYRDRVSLGVAETTLKLRRRAPNEERLAWAEAIAAEIPEGKPRNRTEVYALEQIYLHKEPERAVRLQALRIGNLGVAAIPCEVFGITGLKIKRQSPLEHTFVLELTNGAEGYIPPPEQHVLGGYTTWPARTAALEVQAEPRIVEATLQLLEKVAGKPRRSLDRKPSRYAQVVLQSDPLAYWPLNEMAGPTAADITGNDHRARYEPGVVFWLPGAPLREGGPLEQERAAHFAGGRVAARLDGLGEQYTVEFWFWNGLPNDARAVTGYLFSRGPDAAASAPGDHLGIGGTHEQGTLQGKLFFYNGNEDEELLVGKTEIAPRTWHHVALVRRGEEVRVYLDGNPEPEITGNARWTIPKETTDVFLGGRNDALFGLEGRLHEVAVFARALSAEQIARHYQGRTPNGG